MRRRRRRRRNPGHPVLGAILGAVIGAPVAALVGRVFLGPPPPELKDDRELSTRMAFSSVGFFGGGVAGYLLGR